MSKKKKKAADIVDEVLSGNFIRGTHKTVPIELLKPNPWNPNKQSDFMYAKQGKSIQRFGFLQAVLVRSGDENGIFDDARLEIIDGEHRWKKMVELDAKEILVNDIGVLPTHEAMALTDILNRLRGEDDKLKKAAMLTDLIDGFPDLKDVLPYTDSDFEEFGKMSEFDWGSLDNKPKDGDKGSDGGEGGQHSFQVKLSTEQKEIVDAAIKKAKDNAEGSSQARALELICADYIAGSRASED